MFSFYDNFEFWEFFLSLFALCGQDLGVHCELCDGGYWKLSLFSPYWMINKTQRDLTYKVHGKLPLLD